ncbi:MAG: hypothetical protein OXN89_03455 [Bryobacterales bacterium]|nr:hypothetical protein [Bryobacterales bacterium]
MALEEELERFLGKCTAADLDFEALEVCLRRQALAIAARLLAQRLTQDVSDCYGPGRPCPDCSRSARYAGRRPKTFLTALGEMELQRAYYRCGACGKGHFPRDENLGMRRTKLSAAVQRMSATAAAMTSFADAASLQEDLTGVRLVPKQVERTAEAIGHELANVPREGQERPPAAPTMYVGVDGTGIPVRKSEVAGRKGKQTNGAARTREAKLVVVFTAEARDEEGRPQLDQGSVTYSGAIESFANDPFAPEPSTFSPRVWREASWRGVFGAQRRVVIGDGPA